MYSRCDLSTGIFIRIYGYGYGALGIKKASLLLRIWVSKRIRQQFAHLLVREVRGMARRSGIKSRRLAWHRSRTADRRRPCSTSGGHIKNSRSAKSDVGAGTKEEVSVRCSILSPAAQWIGQRSDGSCPPDTGCCSSYVSTVVAGPSSVLLCSHLIKRYCTRMYCNYVTKCSTTARWEWVSRFLTAHQHMNGSCKG